MEEMPPVSSGKAAQKVKARRTALERGEENAVKAFEGLQPVPASRSQTVAADPRLTFTVEEAGRILGISRGSAYALARKGVIPSIRLGNRLLVPKAALERLLAV